MRKHSRILTVLLCLVLALSLCSGGALASGEPSGGSGESGASAEPIEYGFAGAPSGLTVSGAVNLPDGTAVIEDRAILAVGGSAIQNAGASDLTVRDSVVVAVDPAPTRPLAGNPGNLLVAGNVRATLALSQGRAYYVNSTVIGSNWAALSTDGAVPATEPGQRELSLYAYGSLARTTEGGYGAYSDLFCNLRLYGSDIEAAEIGIISGTYGTVLVSTIGQAENDPDMAAHLTEADRSAQADPDKGSVVSGGRNALMIHSVNLPPYWEYEGYSQQELPLHSTSAVVYGSTLRTDAALDRNVSYDPQKQAYIDHTAGSVILIKSTNANITLSNSRLLPDPDGTGALIHTVYNNDTMFMNAVPDGEVYPGVNVYMLDMSAEGDILHEDYQRDMYVLMSRGALTGAVNGYDCEHWNAVAAQEGFTDYALDASYAARHGVTLELRNGSSWTVTGPSSLCGLTIEEGSTVTGSMTVDGVPTPLLPGAYRGDIRITP